MLRLYIFLLFTALLLFFACYPTLSIFPIGPAPTVHTQGGDALQIGYVQDINNDGLPDIVLSYYSRDYNFASLVIFMNDGCQFVRHFDPLQPIIYCAYYFDNLRRIKWEQDPPTANVTLFNQTQIIPLPFFEWDVPLTVSRFFNVPLSAVPRITFTINNTRVAYPALLGASNIVGGMGGGGMNTAQGPEQVAGGLGGQGQGTSGGSGQSGSLFSSIDNGQSSS
ncbi:hypothetical protein ABK040_001746 [Willaertia magna]